uniref:SRCR domain-containing protein n=1 Tax=Macrostomum lignano TaxID=282301 RepID=A0A1I8FQ39_9PLAT
TPACTSESRMQRRHGRCATEETEAVSHGRGSRELGQLGQLGQRGTGNPCRGCQRHFLPKRKLIADGVAAARARDPQWDSGGRKERGERGGRGYKMVKPDTALVSVAAHHKPATSEGPLPPTAEGAEIKGGGRPRLSGRGPETSGLVCSGLKLTTGLNFPSKIAVTMATQLSLLLPLLLLAPLLASRAAGLSLTGAAVKTLEGSRHARSRREATSPFIPLRLFGDSNPEPQPGYPRTSPDSKPDELSPTAPAGAPDAADRANPRRPDEDEPQRGPRRGQLPRRLGARLRGANRVYKNSYYGTGHYKRQDIIVGHVQCKHDGDELTLFDCNRKLMPPCDLNSTTGIECIYNTGCDWGWSSFDGLCYRLETEPKTATEAATPARPRTCKMSRLCELSGLQATYRTTCSTQRGCGQE